MLRKVKKSKVVEEEIEVPQEPIEIDHEEEVIQTPTKKPISEKRLLSLQKAREAAAIKKKEIKVSKDKAKNIEKLELEIKGIEYDKLLQKKQDLQTAPEAPIIIPIKPKKIVKKIIEVEETESEPESEEEEIIVKKVKAKKQLPARERFDSHSQPQNYNQLLYHSAANKIQERLLDERAKSLMSTLMPNKF